MSTSAVAVSQGTFTDAEFDAVAAAYGADDKGAKFRRLVDAIVSLGVDEREDHLSRVENLIGLLEGMAENGAGYTPPTGKGFGSDNASQIAEKILGRSQAVSATRKAFSDWGKNVS